MQTNRPPDAISAFQAVDPSVDLTADDIIDTDLRELFLYWSGKHNGGRLPSRADLDPVHIPRLLPHVMLWDVLADPLDFRVRLAGTEICRRFGEELTGRLLREIDMDGKTELIHSQYSQAARTGRPRLDSQEYERHDGRYMHYVRLILPLSTDGTRVDMLLVGQRALGVDGYPCRPHRVL